MAKAEVRNEAKLLRKLTIIPQAMRGEIYHALGDAADEITDMMRRLVPVEPGKPDLRDSIGWRWGRRAPKGSVGVATLQGAQRDDLTITIYAADNQTFYGTFVEFGTVKMAARPFFFVSWRANRKNARSKIRAAVRRAAKRVAAS